MIFLLYLFVMADFVDQGIGESDDPCSGYSDIPDLDKRRPSFRQDNIPLCDRYLLKNWYRAESHKMPTEPPTLVHCGTLYPYWMKGDLPGIGQIATVTVCQVGFQKNCVRNHPIRVKNCDGFYIYELTPLPSCNSAYCFEQEQTKNCIEEIPTGLSVAFHNVSWEHRLQSPQNPNIYGMFPTVNLICNFSPLSNDKYLYHISWYIDNTEILNNQTVTADGRMDAILSADYIVNAKKKAGSMIQCMVGAKQTEKDYPCKTGSSPLFFAGIKISPTNLTIQRGGEANLSVQLTIPYADEIFYMDGKEINTNNLLIELANFDDQGACSKGKIRINNCDIKIPSLKYSEGDNATGEWNQSQILTIYNTDNGTYQIDKHLTLRFKTASTQFTSSKIFENVFISDIQVFIEDLNSVWKGKKCESVTDPNLLTFDKLSYGCQLIGTFILYRNDVHNQEVQEKHFPCHQDATCNCAVAVRSGRDVFTIDICNGKVPLINFPFCEDKILMVQKYNDRKYVVILPTGTIVTIHISDWDGFTFLNTFITPSPSDVNNTLGLCGILDGDSTNDFTERDSTKHSTEGSPNTFSASWMADDSENLLIYNQTVYEDLESISNTMARICFCSETSGEYKILCNYNEVQNCNFKIGKRLYCILNPATSRRRKRDLTHIYSKSIKSDVPFPLEFAAKRYKKQATLMSYEEAKSTCLREFQKSPPYLKCQLHVDALGNSSLLHCISDLMITRDIKLGLNNIETAIDECKVFIILNVTFQQLYPEIVHEILSFCPSNCSGENGNCYEGTCSCKPGFAGSDCSFDSLSPITITNISGMGLCDKSEEDCDEITLDGKYFLDNMKIYCHTNMHRLSVNGSVLSIQYFERNLEGRTLTEGFCPLEYSTAPSWVTHFIFNVSNDRRHYTENYNVYTYQSMCQEFQNISGKISFTLKDGFCFVDGLCVADGSSNPNNLCDTCDVSRERYSWTVNNVSGHCFIDGRCISSGGVHDKNKCQYCDPNTDINSWAVNQDYCLIDNVCYFDGKLRENSSREICNITADRYRWSINSKGGEKNPCSALVYSELPDLPRRNTSYKQDYAPLCDRYLIKKWYRGGFSVLAREAPALVSCGTLYPYWMKGEYPARGTTETVTVCQVGFESNCVKSHTIQMRNCGAYAVYELTPLDACNSAYCFTDIQ